ncbi:hypothetical protein [Corynebacterium pelargi]|uniref:Uncharacterized protein n=1 Tax=Corynebacterium pelargi TaxID=1471400 RepID=A0A410W8U7_9CORY|nr:hypothetical protein [Corynebacterium pelargi]QAU52368.1 hypothetical protein CPELA_05485 [Corynebacterium pelargi]GGG68179.1 hypothetical protein GCM10007338_01000 [Corynebacterium pelargi]
MSNALRVGGAFVAVGAALFLLTLVQVLVQGWMVPFPVTWSFIAIILAAGFLGAFATTDKRQPGSRIQVSALALAVGLVFLGRLLPQEPLMVWQQYWLPAYGLAAIACGLVIRRSTLR